MNFTKSPKFHKFELPVNGSEKLEAEKHTIKHSILRDARIGVTGFLLAVVLYVGYTVYQHPKAFMNAFMNPEVVESLQINKQIQVKK